MSMLSNGTKVVAFHDDHKPVKVATYREDGLIEVPISEPVDQEQTGKLLTFDDTYNDTAEVKVYGESQQKTLTGKNLLVYPFPYQVNTPKSQTINGVTWINNGDGSLTVSGTATNISYYNLDFTTDITPLIGKTVTISNGSSNIQLRLDAFTNLDDKTYKSLAHSIEKPTVEISDDALAMRIWLAVRADKTVNETIYPQIELGTKATEYEPYCGGIPSPNPDYPQEITSLTKASVETCGRNLMLGSDKWKSESVYTTAAGITATVEDGVLKVVAINGNENWIRCGLKNVIEANLNEGDPFTFSIEIKSEDGTKPPTVYFKPGMYYRDMTGSVSSEYSWVYSTGEWKKTNGIVFHLGFRTAIGTYYIRKIKFEKGTTPTPWEPDKQSTIDLTSLLNGKELRSLPDGTRDELIVERDGTVKFVQRVWSATATGYNGVATGPNAKYASLNGLDSVIPRWKSYDDSVDDGKPGSMLCDKLINYRNIALKSTYAMIGRTWNGVFLYASPDADDSVFDVGEIHFLCKIPAITTTLGTIDQLQTFYGQTNIWEANGADISANVRVMPE